MPNHYRLLVETPQPNLGNGMHLLNGRYARRFNARHERVGHLFQGLYRAEVVERDEHLLEPAHASMHRWLKPGCK
jgi:REP element-mobilizing transposase RayT